MGQFYFNKIKNSKIEISYYSERGLMTFLTNEYLNNIQNFMYFLKNTNMCHDGKKTLQDMLEIYDESVIDKVVIFNEFDLGSDGFGCPDGAIYIEYLGMAKFIFLEAKACT